MTVTAAQQKRRRTRYQIMSRCYDCGAKYDGVASMCGVCLDLMKKRHRERRAAFNLMRDFLIRLAAGEIEYPRLQAEHLLQNVPPPANRGKANAERT